MSAGMEVVPATGDRFAMVEHALTGGGDGASCWCRWLIDTRAAFDAASRDERKAALLTELSGAAVPPGLVVTIDDEAVGWVRVAPRTFADPEIVRGSGESARHPAARALNAGCR